MLHGDALETLLPSSSSSQALLDPNEILSFFIMRCGSEYRSQYQYCGSALRSQAVLQGDAVEDLLPSSSNQEPPHADEYAPAPESSQQAASSAASGSAHQQQEQAGQLQRLQQVDLQSPLHPPLQHPVNE